MNSGCARFGRDLNSGWILHADVEIDGLLSSTVSTSRPSGEVPLKA